MTAVAPQPITSRPYPARVAPKGSVFLKMLRTTDPKDIAILYLVASFGFFLTGGLMALLMRAELAVPGQQFLSNEQYNQLFTMHGTIMLLLYATPILFGFANYIVPLQIGAPDVAFPRLNAFSFWLFLFGGLTVMSGFLTPGGAADFGWFAYTPLSDAIHSPGVGADLWIIGLVLAGLGTILGGVNFITTVVCMRAPGMTMFRMPIFTWNIFVTAILVLIAFPVLTAALLRAAGRPPPRRPRVRPGQRRRHPLAAPVLVLRPPRGLHRRAAVLRHRVRGLPGVQPQAAVRLQGPGLRDDLHRARCRWPCGRTTCTPPARCCWRSSRSPRS